jgi:hypothetical protein
MTSQCGHYAINNIGTLDSPDWKCCTCDLRFFPMADAYGKSQKDCKARFPGNLKFNYDPNVPRDEVHVYQDGKATMKIVGIDTGMSEEEYQRRRKEIVGYAEGGVYEPPKFFGPENSVRGEKILELKNGVGETLGHVRVPTVNIDINTPMTIDFASPEVSKQISDAIKTTTSGEAFRLGRNHLAGVRITDPPWNAPEPPILRLDEVPADNPQPTSYRWLLVLAGALLAIAVLMK